MIHALLTLLAVIGKVLLILLLILLALLLCLLFVPFCYRIHFKKDAKSLSAKVRVAWLLFLLRFHLAYEGKKVSYELYILGIPVLRLIQAIKKKRGSPTRRRKRPGKKTKKKENFPSGTPQGAPGGLVQGIPDEDHTGVPGGVIQEASEETSTGVPGGVIQATPGEAYETAEERPSLFQRIGFTIRKVCGKIKGIYSILSSQQFHQAFPSMGKEGMLLLKHILPRSLKGYMEFGFEDPAVTGQVLGGIGMFYGALPGKLEIYPDFEEKKLNADIKARGRIHLVCLLIHGLKLLKSYKGFIVKGE